MAATFNNIWLQSLVVSDDSANTVIDMSSPDGTANYQYLLKGASSNLTPADALALPESEILISTLKDLPVLKKSELLLQEYKELGEALATMTELGQEDDLMIEKPVFSAATYIASILMATEWPVPAIFTHGPKSVVFNWTEGPNNLYITVSADRLSALVSTPDRIKKREDHALAALANPSQLFLALQSAHLDEPIVSTNTTATDQLEEPSDTVG